MKTITLPSNRPQPVEVIIPSEWDELTKGQFIRIAPKLKKARFIGRSFYAALKKELESTEAFDITLQSLRIEFFYILLGFRSWALSRSFGMMDDFFDLFPDELSELCKHTNFLFQENTRTINPVPKKRRFCRVYHGPSNRLSNITAGEFDMAERFFTRWMEKEDPESLDLLVATLYRTKGKGEQFNPDSGTFCGDVREPFNPHSIESRVKKFKKMSLSQKLAIAHFFEGCRNTIIKSYPTLYKKPKEYKVKKAESNPGEGWVPVFRSLSKDPIRWAEIANMKLAVVLNEMEATQEEARKQKLKKN